MLLWLQNCFRGVRDINKMGTSTLAHFKSARFSDKYPAPAPVSVVARKIEAWTHGGSPGLPTAQDYPMGLHESSGELAENGYGSLHSL